ncbi:hypothetical protein WN943_006405 [Citrus x changshan-huyou]
MRGSPMVVILHWTFLIILRGLSEEECDLVKALKDVGIVPRYKGFTHHKSTCTKGVIALTDDNNIILKSGELLSVLYQGRFRGGTLD